MESSSKAGPAVAGKTVFITGSNRGIGRALAHEFAAAGSNLIAHVRQETEAFKEEMAALASEHGVSVECVAFDLADVPTMKQAVNAALPAGRRIDVLVNNAAVAHGGLFQMTPVATVRQIFEVNLFAQMELTQLMCRRMVRQKSGSIVNMASIAGLDLAAGNIAYGASKAALIAFTRTLAAELGPLGLRVNAVAPGLTETEMATKMEAKAGARMVESSAMRRLALPMEIARVVLFLASEDSSFINGEVLRVDGGRV
jgi:3-oxoacyl-[acyl-carrier protein] reductase